MKLRGVEADLHKKTEALERVLRRKGVSMGAPSTALLRAPAAPAVGDLLGAEEKRETSLSLPISLSSSLSIYIHTSLYIPIYLYICSSACYGARESPWARRHPPRRSGFFNPPRAARGGGPARYQKRKTNKRNPSLYLSIYLSRSLARSLSLYIPIYISIYLHLSVYAHK